MPNTRQGASPQPRILYKKKVEKSFTQVIISYQQPIFILLSLIVAYFMFFRTYPMDQGNAFCTENFVQCKMLENMASNDEPKINSRILPRPVVLCHRGGRGLAPENTMESIQSGVDHKCDILEFDLHATKDGHFILSHNPDLHETTNLNLSSLPHLFPHMPVHDDSLLIRKFTLNQLQTLDFGYWFTPDNGTTYPWRNKGVKCATFHQVLDKYAGYPMMIEMKDPSHFVAEKVYNIIRSYEIEDKVMVGSKWFPVINHFQQLAPHIPIAANKYETLWFFLRNKLLGANALKNPNYHFLVAPWTHGLGNFNYQEMVDDAHNNGLLVFYWTLNTKESISKAISLGADGIITDFPDIAYSTLKQLGYSTKP